MIGGASARHLHTRGFCEEWLDACESCLLSSTRLRLTS